MTTIAGWAKAPLRRAYHCSNFHEDGGHDAEDHLRRIARKYDLEKAVEVFIAHMRGDPGLMHANLLTTALY
jgi:hypothetical protein